MINKLEQKLDREFKSMNVKPRVYHFLDGVSSFEAVTIADTKLSWCETRKALDVGYFCNLLYWHNIHPASDLLHELEKKDIYGIAVCDYRDTFNRQRGRIIAKGRLLKHLKEIEE